ncbi:MAG: histidine phosphatase family protein [Thiotrichales bacterium]|nr:histidine phosphatase family protein [Thiotrichales bacterium]
MDMVMIRHGMTAWNEAGRIQGHTDIPLCAAGRRALAGRWLPARFVSYRVYSSPLVRAVETAALLGLGAPLLDRRLMEMHWGEWEGEIRASLAAADPDGVARNTARGRDFRPPGGESPREVQARIVDWARSVARLQSGGSSVARPPSGVVAVTHKGVIKSMLGLAFDWDLTGKNPVRLDWTCAHRFRFDPGTGECGLEEPNIRLDAHE